MSLRISCKTLRRYQLSTSKSCFNPWPISTSKQVKIRTTKMVTKSTKRKPYISNAINLFFLAHKKIFKYSLLQKYFFTTLILRWLLNNQLRKKHGDTFVNKCKSFMTVLQKPPQKIVILKGFYKTALENYHFQNTFHYF